MRFGVGNAVVRVGLSGALACSLVLAGCGGGEKEAPKEQTQEAVTQDAGEGSAASDATDSSYGGEKKTSERLDKLVLVNKTHALPDGWENDLDLVKVQNSKGETVSIDRMAYEPFVEMQQYLESQGVTIELNSGYRSIAEQQRIVDEFTVEYGEDYVREFVAVPGYSEHHTGIAFDVFLTIDGYPILTNDEIFAAQDTWDIVHAALHKYGFILRYMDGKEDITGYTYEPWHYRYVGVDAATEIWEKGLTLEEYLGEVD